MGKTWGLKKGICVHICAVKAYINLTSLSMCHVFEGFKRILEYLRENLKNSAQIEVNTFAMRCGDLPRSRFELYLYLRHRKRPWSHADPFHLAVLVSFDVVLLQLYRNYLCNLLLTGIELL